METSRRADAFNHSMAVRARERPGASVASVGESGLQRLLNATPDRPRDASMDSHELMRLLEAVRLGDLSTSDAAHRLRTPALEETGGFATVDLHRRVRCGFPEVIFGQGKTTEQVIAILGTMVRHG